MKLFWSWQSDTPGNTGRRFVREALDLAVAQLKGESVLEPTERETVEDLEELANSENLAELHVDQDRQDVGGSSDLAIEILAKIAKSDVFVADVTSVGVIDPKIRTAVRARLEAGGAKPKQRKRAHAKRLINANVGIELGYAYHKLTNAGVLLVMNTYYGDYDDLPFDLRHKGAIVDFELAPEAEKNEREAVKRVLVRRLVKEISLCLSTRASKQAPDEGFPTAAETLPGLYFPFGETLAEGGYPGEQPFAFSAQPYAFLRFHPIAKVPPVGRHQLTQIFRANRMISLSQRHNPIARANRYGAIAFQGAGTMIQSLVQGFPTGELWAVAGDLFERKRLFNQDETVIVIIRMEKAFRTALTNYVAVATKVFGFQPPFQITMGVAGIQNARLMSPDPEMPSQATFPGPIYDAQVTHTVTLKSTDEAVMLNVLRAFFVKVYDAAGADRAAILTDALVQGHQLAPR